MECKNCGAVIGSKGKCEYCGTEISREQIQQNKQEIIKDYAKKGWNKLTIPTKLTLAFWTICCIANISSIKEIGFIEYICVVLFGYLFFGIIAQIISSKKKRLRSGKKITAVNAVSKKLSDNPYDEMDGHEFEYFCGDILGKNGFTGVEVTKGSGDQGIDIIAFKDGVKYGIQCKCYSSNIGNKAVQEAFAGKTFYGCHVSAVLTNQYFTNSAKELAEKNGVLLWDRDRLESFVNSYK